MVSRAVERRRHCGGLDHIISSFTLSIRRNRRWLKGDRSVFKGIRPRYPNHRAPRRRAALLPSTPPLAPTPPLHFWRLPSWNQAKTLLVPGFIRCAAASLKPLHSRPGRHSALTLPIQSSRSLASKLTAAEPAGLLPRRPGETGVSPLPTQAVLCTRSANLPDELDVASISSVECNS